MLLLGLSGPVGSPGALGEQCHCSETPGDRRAQVLSRKHCPCSRHAGPRRMGPLYLCFCGHSGLPRRVHPKMCFSRGSAANELQGSERASRRHVL